MGRVLVTGGAGFIGSHLVDALIKQTEVAVLDNLSTGHKENIAHHMDNPSFEFVEGSISSERDVERAIPDVDSVFHMAAQPDVRFSVSDPLTDFEMNVVGSMRLLEYLRKADVTKIVFASSGGTVYGDSEVSPTPEETRLSPISNYGAAKSAFEMYLSSYAELYGMSAVSMRLGNIIGPRSTAGVVYDFYQKLKRDPTRLEVLGNGEQTKAYMYVTDAVRAAVLLADRMEIGHLPVNVSSGERLRVSRIAEIVCDGLGARNARIEFTGSERGWKGDVVETDLDVTLLRSFGWTPSISIEHGIALYLDWLVESFGPVD